MTHQGALRLTEGVPWLICGCWAGHGALQGGGAVGPYPVLATSTLDGTKFLLEDDNWLLIRFSGTEPLLRIVAEADTLAKAQTLVEWGKRLTDIE